MKWLKGLRVERELRDLLVSIDSFLATIRLLMAFGVALPVPCGSFIGDAGSVFIYALAVLLLGTGMAYSVRKMWSNERMWEQVAVYFILFLVLCALLMSGRCG